MKRMATVVSALALFGVIVSGCAVGDPDAASGPGSSEGDGEEQVESSEDALKQRCKKEECWSDTAGRCAIGKKGNRTGQCVKSRYGSKKWNQCQVDASGNGRWVVLPDSDTLGSCGFI